MRIGINTTMPLKRYGSAEPRTIKELAKLLSEAGFKYVDYTSDLIAENWQDKAKADKDAFAEFGITVNQTHAYYNRYGRYDELDFAELTRRAFVVTDILGAKFCVDHADEYRVTDRYDAKEILESEYQRLLPHAEFCAKHGITLALENLFEDGAKIRGIVDGKSRHMARIEEVVGLIDRFNSENVKCCWDFGHAHVAFGKDQLEMMKIAGSRIVCTHVHDNYYGKDLHLIPFQGQVDWDGHMKALKSFGYQGVLSFEFAYGCYPDDVLPVVLKTIYSVGSKLSDMFENA